MNDQKRAFSPIVQQVIDEFMPICWKLAEGRGKYAMSVGGSQGKGLSDATSDVDFRLFHEKDIPWMDADPDLWKDYNIAAARWAGKGVLIDGVWCRRIDEIEAMLSRWLDGDTRPQECIWSIWGYHLLPDLYHQAVLEDKYGVIADWKGRLQAYPPRLKKALLDKHIASARYWRNDYHYRSKVRRGDFVFTAGLSARLVHDLMQILFALNETYYVGDGQNLDFAAKFKIVPPHYAEKVKAILYPQPSDEMLNVQYDKLACLVDEVIQLSESKK